MVDVQMFEASHNTRILEHHPEYYLEYINTFSRAGVGKIQERRQ